MGNSSAIDRLMDVMAKATGTPFAPVRDGLVVLAGQYFDLVYGFRSWRRKEELLHPLSELIVTQVPDPMVEWNVSDVPAFRVEFSSMLNYLPRKVVCATEDREVKAGGISMPVRVFTPKRLRTSMKLIFLHGGGFVLGDFDSNDPECDEIARAVGCQVLSIGYPLSPEHKYPAALDSIVDALENSALSGADKYVLMGESAGGNLALGALQGSKKILSNCTGLVLAYPFLDLTLGGESVARYGDGFFLTRGLLEWFDQCYLDPGMDSRNSRISPLFGKMEHLPPSLVLVGEFDPLRSDAVRFSSLNSRSHLEVFAGMIHGFLQIRGLCPSRDRALKMVAEFVKTL